jgi:hypothetical protein
VVVVVAHPILEPRRRPGGLDAPDEAFGGQNGEGVVHRLQRNGTDLGPNDSGDRIGGDVRRTRDGPQNSQTLRRDLNTSLAKKLRRVRGHRDTIDHDLE